MSGPAKPRLSAKLTAHLALLAVVAVWGVTFPVVKAALHDISPLLFNLLRMLLAFGIMATANFRSLRRLTRAERRLTLRYGAIAGVCLGVGYQFQTSGLAHTSASKSAFITGLVVVFVPLLGLFPGVRPQGTALPGLVAFLGAFVAFAGLVLLTTLPGSGSAILSGLGVGEWLTLLCAIAFAAHLLVLSRAGAHVGARVLGTLQVGFAACVMLATLPLGGPLQFHATPRVLLALAITAIFATAIAFTVQSWAQQHIPASHTALIVTMEPVFAWLTSLFFLGERLGARALAGAGLILAGILVSELFPQTQRSGGPFTTASSS